MVYPILQPRAEDRPYLRRLGWTLAIAAAVLVVWRASDLLLLAFGSTLGAIMFISIAERLQKLGIRNRSAALGLAILLVLAFIGGVAWLVAAQFGGQLAAMASDLPNTLAAIEGKLSESPVGKAIVEATHAALGGGTIANSLGSFALGSGTVLLNLVIVLVGAMFIAGKPGPYVSGMVLLAPPPARPAVRRTLEQIGFALRLWLRLKVFAMLAMTVLISAGLWFAGVKSWAALGLIGGISEFVPYVGPTVAMVPAIGLAALQSTAVLWNTLIAFLVIRVIEAYALTPFLNSSVVAIPPAVTLFVILGAGAVFGPYGLFLAGALLVVVFVAVRELYLRDTLGEDIEGVPEEART